jgi:DNA polymerase II small subunit
MQYLLKARHMSPIYGSQTPIAPELEDLMVIDEVPDIFHGGHVHVVDLDLYRGVLILNSGAWQAQTPFQTSVGITPTPGMAVLVNLKTFKVYTKDFASKN